MNLAILGTDPDLLRLAAAARDAGHQFVWVGDVRPEDVSAIAPGLPDRASEWELLLDRGTADAVLVGHGTAPSELRAEQLKRLATESVPLLVVHPAFESVLPCYEIDMARRESGGIVQHFNPIASKTMLSKLRELVQGAAKSIGEIHQFSCERRLPDSSRAIVLSNLSRDVELLAAVAGDIKKVNAIGPAAKDDSFASLTLQMVTAGTAPVRWSVRAVGPVGTGLSVTILAARGSFNLWIPDTTTGVQALGVETTLDGQSNRETLEFADPAIEAIAALSVPQLAASSAASSTWDAATRAMEVVDAVELSLEKGRTIEVFQQQLTEQLAFRGTMAAMGCGLILLGFFVVVLVTIFGGAEGDTAPKLISSWAIILLAVLGFFLLLQAVPMLAQQSKAKRQDATPPLPKDTR